VTSPYPKPQILAHKVSGQGVAFQLRKYPRGVVEAPGRDNTLISMHIGPAAELACRRAGRWFRGRAVHGDIDIIPANTPAHWEMFDDNDTDLLLSLPQALLDSTVVDTGYPVEVRNRNQIRDSELETLCWAIQ